MIRTRSSDRQTGRDHAGVPGQAEGGRGRRSRTLRWALLGAGAVVVVAVGAIATLVNSAGDPGSTDAQAFDLPVIEGEGRVRLADFAGTPVVVNFFASWCTACDAELPGFAAVSRELEGEVSFIGVNALETGDRLLRPERHGITWWPLARDIGGRNGSGLHAALGGRGMPITAFYDEAGRLLHVDGGAVPEQALRARLADLYGFGIDGDDPRGRRRRVGRHAAGGGPGMPRGPVRFPS
jgi:cytochrome c biogenesis protein CcmG, thiol:disulfide interchange protein DsbE